MGGPATTDHRFTTERAWRLALVPYRLEGRIWIAPKTYEFCNEFDEEYGDRLRDARHEDHTFAKRPHVYSWQEANMAAPDRRRYAVRFGSKAERIAFEATLP